MEIEDFLSQKLAFSMNQNKSKIILAFSQYARFLGYDCGVYGNIADKITSTSQGKKRSAHYGVELRLPAKYVEKRSREWQRDGKPKIDGNALAYSVEEAFTYYQIKFRGIVNYYQYTVDVHELSRLWLAMELSLVHTLSAKLKISVAKVGVEYKTKIEVDGTTYKVGEVLLREMMENSTHSHGALYGTGGKS